MMAILVVFLRLIINKILRIYLILHRWLFYSQMAIMAFNCRSKGMPNNAIILAGEEIQPGTKKTILFPAPNINMQVKLDIPAHVFHGKNSGPTMFITGSIHGDELNSIEIIRRVHAQLNPQELSGTIITV